MSKEGRSGLEILGGIVPRDTGSFSLYFPWKSQEEAFFTYIWSFVFTVELLCLQSVEALLRNTVPL